MKTQVIICGLMTSLLTGCASETKSDFTPIEGGFGYVTHVRRVDEGSLSAGFCYRDSSGNTKNVWPHLEILWGNNMVVSNDTAFFVGGRGEVYNDGKERLRERLIAFKAPSGLPLDITDQVLQKYCAESGVSFTNVIKDSFVSLVKTNGGVRILFGIIKIGERGPGTITDHDAFLIIPWHDMQAIMQDVKKNGKLKKEKWSGTEYLQKD